jgi:hypothetical protein
MVGSWHIPKITLYSTNSIPALSGDETIIEAGKKYEYSKLGLLTSDDKTFYLVDLKTFDYYKSKPNVYVIPRSDSLILNLIVSPHVLATPTPTSTTTPTSMPAPTITITLTP